MKSRSIQYPESEQVCVSRMNLLGVPVCDFANCAAFFLNAWHVLLVLNTVFSTSWRLSELSVLVSDVRKDGGNGAGGKKSSMRG